MADNTIEKIFFELEMIRKIKMIELMERGYSQAKLGSALGVSQSSISRMLAGKKPEANRAKGKGEGDGEPDSGN